MTGPVHGDYSWSLLAQEQQAQAGDLKDLRFTLKLALARIDKLEQQVATLQAAWAVHFEEEGQNDDATTTDTA